MTSRAIIDEMRDWLLDCFDSEVIEGLSDAEIIAGVERHYIGGKVAFLAACEWDAA